MSDLKTIQAEIDDLTKHAQTARDSASKSLANAELHRSGGDTGRAEFESGEAFRKQTEATSFDDKLRQKQKEEASLRQEAQLVQKQIADLQHRLATITGDSHPGIL